MKSIILLIFILSISSAFAEQFTLTRDDGKVFTCSDQLGGPSTGTVTVCTCNDQYGENYGSVIGVDVMNSCKGLVGNRAPRLNNCSNLQGSINNATCTCKDQYGENYGLVVGADSMGQCKTLVGNRSPRLIGCQIQ